MALWNTVIENFEKKLSVWKGKYLSLGGRIMLIKACLSNLPVYDMSLFKMPKGVDRLRRNFLWKGQSDGRKIQPLKWEGAFLVSLLGRGGRCVSGLMIGEGWVLCMSCILGYSG